MTTIAQVKVRFDRIGRNTKYYKALQPEKHVETKHCKCGRLILACFKSCWRCRREETYE